MVIKKGEQMLASDILDLTFFPVGTILTFSSAAWNATSTDFKDIWKICDTANNETNSAIPDLTNKFLRGGSESADGWNNPNTGNTQSIDVAMKLPSHDHGVITTLSVANSGSHTHGFTGHNESGGSSGTCGVASGDISRAESSSGEVDPAGTHSHALNGAVSVESKGENNPFTRITVNTMPSYYTVIYIIKVK